MLHPLGGCDKIMKLHPKGWIRMKIHESAENYLETILVLQQRKGSVRSVDIANELEFSKPSVSVAMKNLRLNGYIEMDSSGQIRLLPSGQLIAEAVLEKHRMMTMFLVALGVSPEVAAEDACRIEHVLSDESFEAIKRHAEKYSNS